mmetsp:Transcript_55736/g.126632  ORF Transcript_55736/g.126632 Transcript_55736/m.126632 type:complete len:351 (+) Transcript_55736:689-1741(+)
MAMAVACLLNTSRTTEKSGPRSSRKPFASMLAVGTKYRAVGAASHSPFSRAASSPTSSPVPSLALGTGVFVIGTHARVTTSTTATSGMLLGMMIGPKLRTMNCSPFSPNGIPSTSCCVPARIPTRATTGTRTKASMTVTRTRLSRSGRRCAASTTSSCSEIRTGVASGRGDGRMAVPSGKLTQRSRPSSIMKRSTTTARSGCSKKTCSGTMRHSTCATKTWAPGRKIMSKKVSRPRLTRGRRGSVRRGRTHPRLAQTFLSALGRWSRARTMPTMPTRSPLPPPPPPRADRASAWRWSRCRRTGTHCSSCTRQRGYPSSARPRSSAPPKCSSTARSARRRSGRRRSSAAAR